MQYGHFDDSNRSYVITKPLTPRPWINYLGNRRLKAFISQNAGGLLWYLEPYTRRISRYHYVAPPGDRPGFYVYVRDRRTGEIWNPHFAPVCAELESFVCRHEPGITTFAAAKDSVRVELTYTMAPDDDVMLWLVDVTNDGDAVADLEFVSYLEFGLLEFMREALGWCYLKNHFALKWHADLNAIHYDYHVFEAPDTPCMLFAATDAASGYDCSREAFVGLTGTLAAPAALTDQEVLGNSELPLGGHACASIGVDAKLAPGDGKSFAYVFALAPEWDAAAAMVRKYQSADTVQKAIAGVRSGWLSRFETLQVDSGDALVDRVINTWNPCNSLVTLENARMISTDHMGTDGLRYRDTTQDALAVAHIEPEFAREMMRGVLAQQAQDGGGCFSYFPNTDRPTNRDPHRSDDTVWQVYTVKALIAETGDWSLLDEVIPFRDGGEATVYDHILIGLKHINEQRGPHGLPTLFYADWNDSLAMFDDVDAESVMLAQQLVYSCKQFAELAERRDDHETAEWCRAVADELTGICNSDDVWDGSWYRRLWLSNGTYRGGAVNPQGRIYLNPQSWAVISGVGETDGRSQRAMAAAAEQLNSDCGLTIHTPPFQGFPEPDDPHIGNNPGIGENGSIFCHANTWAIIAECLLGHGDRAFKYYRQMLPESIIERFGAEHYQREPYAFVSSIVGPVSDRFGEGGISWLTGTASWMYIAATQYILGIRPTLDGLVVKPCLPGDLGMVTVMRRFRGCVYEIVIDNQGRADCLVTVDGRGIDGVLPCEAGRSYQVQVQM